MPGSVSVLIATYNRADLLPQALESLFNQTRVPDEIVVVDDGSTDNTPELLKSYGSQLKVIRQENRGLPAARNVGLRAATGDLIAFLDSDDTLPVDSIALRAEYLEAHPEFSAVYGATYMTDLQNRVLGWFRAPPLPSGMIFDELVCRTVFPMHSILLRRTSIEQVGDFDEQLRVQLDLDYWARYGAIYPFAAIDEVVAYYRVHDEMSVIRQADELNRKGIIVQERLIELPAFKNLSLKQQSRAFTSIGKKYLALGESENSRIWLKKAIQSDRTNRKAYSLFGMSLLGNQITSTLINSRRKAREFLRNRNH